MIAISVPKSIVSDFYYSIPTEIGLFTMKGIAKLIADAPGIADGFIYVSMRVAVYPVFDTAAGDKVAKFGCKGPVYRATLELVCHKLERRYMVSGDYNVLGQTLRHTSFDELTATLMLLIETLGRKTELSVSDTVEVSHSAFSLILIPRMNHRPKSRCYELDVGSQRNHAVIAGFDIRTDFLLPAFVKVVDVKAFV